MRLLNPYALALLPLIAVLWLFARHRSPRPRRAVGNLYFWQQTTPSDPANFAFARLRRHRLLALQIAFMLAAIAALARPITFGGVRVALVFDVSPSMGALDASGSRLDAARRRAAQLMAALPWRSRARIFAAGSSVLDLGEAGTSSAALAATLGRLTISDRRGSIADAVDFARHASGASSVYVFSDQTPIAGSTGQSTLVRWERVGTSLDNVAITRLAIRALPLAPADGELLVEIHNFGRSDRDVPVEVRQRSAVIHRAVVSLPRRSARTIVVPASPSGGPVTARIAPRDALATDDERTVIPASTAPIRILLSTRAGFFLEQSLLADPAAIVDHERRRGVDYDVVVCGPCDDAGHAAGGLLALVSPVDVNTTHGAEPVRVVDPDHPLALGLQNLVSDETVASIAARSSSSGDAVLRAGDTPILIASARDGRRTATLNLNLSSPTLPLTPLFPVMIANTVHWLAHRDESDATADDRVDTSDLIMTDGEAAQENTRPQDRSDANAFRAESARGAANASNEPAGSVGDNVSRPLLALAALLLLVEWRCWTRQERRRAATAFRAIALSLVALAAIGLKVPVGRRPASVVFALDRSNSISPAAQGASVARMNAMSAAMQQDDRAGVVVFGEDAAVEHAPDGERHVADITSNVRPNGSNIEGGLRTARAVLGEGMRRIVLFSDGRETTGDAARETARAAADGIRVDAVATDPGVSERPLFVRRVAAPADVRIGEPFDVSVEVAGTPGARGRVSVMSDDAAAIGRDITIADDGSASVTFTDRRVRPGLYTYRATISAQDQDDSADEAATAGAIVAVEGTPALLYVGAPGLLSRTLAAAGFEVHHTSASDIPRHPAALNSYDAIVVDDVEADRIDRAAAEAVAAHVEHSGAGLLLLGSARSLDAGGYPEGPLGRVLPIDVRPRSGAHAPAMGLVVVFDKSGSMADLASGVSKIELARQAVMKVLDVVRATDAVGVLAFDAAPSVIVPLSASPDRRLLAERLRAVKPSGSTSIAPALLQASDWLRTARVSKRHVLLVSDGRAPAADAARLDAIARSGQFELSVIAIGQDADRPLLERLAAATGGRAYFPDDLRQLPILAAREAARAAGGGIVEERFVVRAASHPIDAAIDRESLPALGGYVVSALKPGAEPVLSSHLDDPILAAWRFGLGRVAVYTGDFHGPWSNGMRTWPRLAAFWSQAVRWVGRRSADRTLQTSIADASGGPRLIVEAEHGGQFLNRLEVTAHVRGPNGDAQEIALAPAAPGRYEAAVNASATGPYLISITARGADGFEARAQRGFFRTADRERAASGPSLDALARIVAPTGGHLLGPAENPFTDARPRAFRETWTLSTMAALVLFLFDVAIRRGIFRRESEPVERGQVVRPSAAA